MPRLLESALLAVLVLSLGGCLKTDESSDAGAVDAATPSADSGTTVSDAGTTGTDAGAGGADSGIPLVNVGGPCANNNACRPGFCAADQVGWPGGYCYQSG